MRLRELEQKDAPLMLEWMHDDSVVHDMQTNFAAKTLEDCRKFITAAADHSESLNLAIADDSDEYMGTVSLKHIADGKAEFAITIRKCAMGRGYSAWGMREIIQKGFEELHLKTIYWCVNPVNKRAVRFYDKNGYKRFIPSGTVNGYTLDQTKSYLWYCVNAN